MESSSSSERSRNYTKEERGKLEVATRLVTEVTANLWSRHMNGGSDRQAGRAAIFVGSSVGSLRLVQRLLHEEVEK